MKRLVNRDMMQEIDSVTMEEIGIPSMVLMERAALKVYEHIVKLTKPDTNVLVVCGIGNNGGDGVAVARMLHMIGISVDLLIVDSIDKGTKQMQEQVTIAKNLSVPIIEEATYNNYSIIVDAIFGVGLKREITGRYQEIISEINQSNAFIIAIDLPSGVNADDGTIMNIAVRANLTVTFGYEKIGLIRYPGADYAGEVIVEDVGFPQVAFQKVMERHEDWVECFTYTREDLKRLPKRPKQSHKGTFGTVLVVAGSKGMSGACFFAAKAALRIGTGLVKILTVAENRQIIQTALPEAVVLTYDEESLEHKESITSYIDTIRDADAIILGPGLGKSLLSQNIMKFVLQYAQAPIVLDADGINILADWITHSLSSDVLDQDSDEYVQRRMECAEKLLHNNVILTPHLKEFSRLLHVDIEKINEMVIDTSQICSYNKLLNYIIKDAVTTVISGKRMYLNTSGNDGLATGGSGDVLSGIIGGLIAQGLDTFEAACLGVYIHGLTAEYYSENKFSGSMLASDIIEQIGTVLSSRLL